MFNETYTFTATIQKPPGPGAYVAVPAEVAAAIGKKRFRVFAAFDGVAYRGSVVTMGGELILGVRKDIMSEIGKSIGDEVNVDLREDLEERVVELPDWMRDGLATDPSALAVYEKLSYSHQKEYIGYVLDAKKEETRLKRFEKMLEVLKVKK